MPMIKIPFAVPPEVYHMLQASAARAGVALPVYVRDVVFKASEIDTSKLESLPSASAPKLTPTKRAILTLLRNHKEQNPGAPYLTTGQISGALQQSDQNVYINVRALTRDGMLDRGENLTRGNSAGAPSKTYAISALGESSLTDDQARVSRTFQEFQAKSQAAYDAVKPPTAPAREDSLKPNVHAALRYIAMAQLGRAVEDETDIEAMKASHARLCDAADSDVSSGAHTYGQILERVTAKIQSLGGVDAIRERFNIG